MHRDMPADYTWGWVWYRWAPALVTASFMLVAYLGAAWATRGLFATRAGFWLVLMATTVVAGLPIAAISRRLDLFARDEQGAFRRDPDRQGISGPSLALTAAWPMLSHAGLEQPVWSYLIAFLAVSVVGQAVFSRVAGRKGADRP